MTGTKRRPIKRRTQTRITPEAIAAFKAGDVKALHEALHLPPWHENPLYTYDHPTGSDGTMGNQTWEAARQLRLKLEEAVRSER